MKMIIAINSKYLEKRIKDVYCDKYEVYILKTKEQVLEMINLNESFIIITRDALHGKMSFIDYLCNIKDKNSKNRIIVILKEITKDIKEKLFSKEIFNIIVGDTVPFDEILDNINNPKMVIYKTKEEKSNIIIVTGLRKSGKTIFCKILSEEIARNTYKSVVVVDLDLIYPSLDIYVKSSKNYALSSLIEDIKNNELKDIVDYQSDSDKYENLKYILNSKCVSTLCTDIIIEILLYLKRFYDYVIVDTSTLMINNIYNVLESINVDIIFCIKISHNTVREYNIQTKFIDEKVVKKSKFIANMFCGKKDIINLLEKKIGISFYGIIKNSIFIDKYISTDNKIYIKYNIKRLLKSIGVIRFENVKNKIINKLVNMKEK